MPPVVHQEADRAEVHAEHGQDAVGAPSICVQRLEHEAVAAERDDASRPRSMDHELASGAQLPRRRPARASVGEATRASLRDMVIRR